MKKVMKSFIWAMNGLRTAWREEVNFRLEVAVAFIVASLGVWLSITSLEWIILVGCITAVISAELINTAVEDLCNKVEPNTDPIIGKVKDIMAGYVLVVSIGAIVIGLTIFSSYL